MVTAIPSATDTDWFMACHYSMSWSNQITAKLFISVPTPQVHFVALSH